MIGALHSYAGRGQRSSSRDSRRELAECIEAGGDAKCAFPRMLPKGAWALKQLRGEQLTLEKMREAAEKLGGVCLSTEYKNLRTKMRWRCAKGHEWESQGQNVRRGKWCLHCSGKMRKSIEEMDAIARSRGGSCLSRRYKNMSTKLRWRCERGHRWMARPHLVKLGQWCPKCANANRRNKKR